MRNDRQSAIEHWDLVVGETLSNEFTLGVNALGAPDFSVDKFVSGDVCERFGGL